LPLGRSADRVKTKTGLWKCGRAQNARPHFHKPSSGIDYQNRYRNENCMRRSLRADVTLPKFVSV
jgi:hypothetical protein